MARTYIGEKLVRKVVYVELEDWETLQEFAKEQNISSAIYLREMMARLTKYKKAKIQAKHIPEQPKRS